MNDESLEIIISIRDKNLKKNGAIIPDIAELNVVGISDDDFYKDRFNFFKKVYGFKMSAMKR